MTRLVVSQIEDLLLIQCLLLGVLPLIGEAKRNQELPCRAHRLSTMVACEVAWLHKLVIDRGQSIHGAVVIYYANVSSIMLAKIPIYHATMKHLRCIFTL